MKEYVQRHIMAAALLFFLALSIAAGSLVAHAGKREFLRGIEVKLADEREALAALADLTDNNGADETISRIIVDCPRRQEYDNLLSTLGSLSKRDLITVQNLSESCGNFYGERKALMVSRLDRELRNYKDLLALHESLSKKDLIVYDLDSWSELVTLEKARSSLLDDLNMIQNQIISALISGHGVNSAEVNAFVSDAREKTELLSVYDKQIDGIREKLHE
jgi:hypothetical protein